MRRKDGFTMIELVLTIEIIVILLLLAWPQLQRAIVTAHENSAAAAVRNIANGQASYKTAGFRDDDGDGDGDYGTLIQLGNPDGTGLTPPFIDQSLSSGFDSGYRFEIAVFPGGGGNPSSYVCVAIPIKPGQSGYKMFYVDDSGMIRCTSDGTAVGANSPPLN